MSMLCHVVRAFGVLVFADVNAGEGYTVKHSPYTSQTCYGGYIFCCYMSQWCSLYLGSTN